MCTYDNQNSYNENKWIFTSKANHDITFVIVCWYCAFEKQKYAYHILSVNYSNDSAVFTIVSTRVFSIGTETNEKAIS